MTETNVPTYADDIDDVDATADRLDRKASAYLADAEDRTFAKTSSIRQAVRDDIHEGRAWARAKADAARDAVVEEPIKTAVLAVGVGVLIGLLLRR